nr:synaptobrevin, longin-like domain protein [Tanacetum cinerariifolium]
MASAIICLATNKKFNFSKYIFDSMVKHLDSRTKFLMYPRRVKRLEKNRRSRTHGLKRLYKVGLSARVESSAEEQSLGEEDASKQERNKDDIDADAEITLVDETTKDQGRFDDQEMFDKYVLNDEEVVVEDVNAASIATDVTATTTTAVSIDDTTFSSVNF